MPINMTEKYVNNEVQTWSPEKSIQGNRRYDQPRHHRRTPN